MHDDARAVAAALAGRRDGFRALFERHRAAVERVVASFAEVDPVEGRELVLESFARGFGQLTSLKEPARFGAWILATTRERCRSCLVRKRDADAISADLASSHRVELAADPGPVPLDLLALVAALPDGAEREAPRLFYVEGTLTGAQIAERLRLSLESATHHLEQLRSQVKARVAARLLAARVEGPPGAGPGHLDASTWNQVLRGVRFPGEAALVTHLECGCVNCERFFLGLHDADGLDGDVDGILVRREAEVRLARHDPAFEQVMRRLHLHLRVTGGALPGGGRSQPSKALPMVLAGALAVVGLGVLALQRPLGAGVHHVASGLEVALDFSVVARGEPRDRGETGQPGASYDEERIVFLHYELHAPAFITLLRVGPDGRAEILAQLGRVGGGRHELIVNGNAAGVSLRGFVGRNRFLAVASLAPVSADALLTLFSAPEAGVAAPPLENAGVGRFEIEVVRALPSR